MAKEHSRKLYDLIQALSPIEQRELKLLIKIKKNETSPLLILFDYILEHDHQDDDQALRDLEPIFKNSKNFGVRKIELYNLVLDLASSHFPASNNQIDIQLRKSIGKAAFLIGRGLLKQALPIIEETIEVAVSYQRPLFLIQALRQKILYLNGLSDFAVMETESFILETEASKCIELLRESFAVYSLDLRSQKYIRQSNLNSSTESIEFYRRALSSPAYSMETPPLAMDLRASHLFMQALYSEHLQISEKGFEHTDYGAIANLYFDFLNSLTDHETEILKSFPGSYLAILNNLTVNSINHSLRMGEQALELFINAEFGDKKAYQTQQIICYSNALRLANASVDEDKFEIALVTFEAYFRRNEKRLEDHHLMRVYFYLAESYFLFGNYRESKIIYQRILAVNAESPQIRIDIAQVAHLMILLITHETGKSRVTIFRWIRKTKAFFGKHGGLNTIEGELIDFFNLSSNRKSIKDRNHLLANLNAFFKLHRDDKDAQLLFAYFRFDIWFSCKQSGQDFQEAIRKFNEMD